MSNKSEMYMMMEMEKKLRELMGAEAYTAFAAKIAREAFRREVEAMADSDFKRYILDHFDEITEDPE